MYVILIKKKQGTGAEIIQIKQVMMKFGRSIFLKSLPSVTGLDTLGYILILPLAQQLLTVIAPLSSLQYNNYRTRRPIPGGGAGDTEMSRQQTRRN